MCISAHLDGMKEEMVGDAQRVPALPDRTGRGAADVRRQAFLEGQLEVLREQLAGMEAADEHRRQELAVARAEVANAQAATRAAQARLEERGHVVAELRDRLERAERALTTAEQERAAVVAALGWRARRQLRTTPAG